MLFHWRSTNCSWLVLCSHLKTVFPYESVLVLLSSYSFETIFAALHRLCLWWKKNKDQQLLKRSLPVQQEIRCSFSLMSSLWWLFSWQFYSCLRQQLFADLMSESLPASFSVLLLQEAAAVGNTNKKCFTLPLSSQGPKESCQWVWETGGRAGSEWHPSLEVCRARNRKD